MASDSKVRFSNRVADYRRFRPDYPPALLDFLCREIPTPAAVADVGSGTGIFSKQLIDTGYDVFAVEPNAAMREAAEEELAANARFHSVVGDAENSNLPASSVSLITAAQAFHWFDPAKFRDECDRILKPGGAVALIWNERIDDTSEFAREYEALLKRTKADYSGVDHRMVGPEKMKIFWRGDRVIEKSFPHVKLLDREAVHGRVTSSSYTPPPGAAGHDELHAELDQIFDRTNAAGVVPFEYECRVYFGRLTKPR